jgi:hypothetical protein
VKKRGNKKKSRGAKHGGDNNEMRDVGGEGAAEGLLRCTKNRRIE